MHTIIIDSNILISALIKNSLTEIGLEEIYSYKLEIIKKSKINEKEFDILLLRLFKYIKLIPLKIIVNFRKEAEEIMGKIDKDDVIFIATALAFNCPIWSDDKHFQKQKIIKILKTSEFISFMNF